MVCREFFRSRGLDDHNIGISIQIQNVHILVGSLDIVKFNAALSRTLQLWPHAAGTLTECGNKYQASFIISSRQSFKLDYMYCIRLQIHLTDTAIPVEFEDRSHESSSSVIFGFHVIQNDLSGLLNSPTQYINCAAPLLRLKVVSFRDDTTIGISWNHTLGGLLSMRTQKQYSYFNHNSQVMQLRSSASLMRSPNCTKIYTPFIHRLLSRSLYSLSLRRTLLKSYARHCFTSVNLMARKSFVKSSRRGCAPPNRSIGHLRGRVWRLSATPRAKDRQRPAYQSTIFFLPMSPPF